MTDYEQAIDDIFGMFVPVWNAESAAVVGYVPEIRYQGVEEKEELPTGKYWCRLSQMSEDEGQATLRNGDCQRYTTDGLLFVQLFCPKKDAEAMTLGRRLSVIARSAYRGKKSPNGVWFRNVRIKELAPESKWIKFNIIAEYEYDENN